MNKLASESVRLWGALHISDVTTTSGTNIVSVRMGRD